MVITGIQVIRGNSAAQDGPDTAVGVLPGQPIEFTYGDRLHLGVSFDYRGHQMNVTLYGAIGTRGFAGFDEIIAAENPIPLPDSLLNFVPVTGSLEIPITADIDPGEKYDLYVKIKEYPKAGMPQVDDVITITGIPPTFKLLEETIYPYAYVYDGPCQVFTFTFTTDPFTPASWIAGKLAAHCEDEVKKAGGRVMEMRVYVDQTPLLWADWRIEVVGIPPATTAGLAMPLGVVWWVAMILVIIALIILIVVTYTFIIKPLTYKHKAIDEKVKAAWSRETLISAIHDFEAKLKRTPTPDADLEKKSDQELRDYCNELAEAVAPGAGAGTGLALAAVGILGLGALGVGAYAMSQPKEKPEKKPEKKR
jgi:hypothetical protein